MRPEDKLEKECVVYAKDEGWLAFKMDRSIQDNGSGWPDRMFISPEGSVVFVEFKTPEGRLEMSQRNRFQTMVENRVLVIIVRTFQEFTQELEENFRAD